MIKQEQQYRKMTPLVKVVKAAIIDSWEDIGKTQELYSHWAARGLRKLQREVLRTGKKFALLPVNRNLMTVTLPPDCDDILFVGYVNDDGFKTPLFSKTRLTSISLIETVEEEICDKCKQKKAICEDLYISEEINLINIDGVLYEEQVTKKMSPNGDYYAEKITPTKNLETGLVTLEKSNEFVTNFDVQECGCLDTGSENLQKLNKYCPETYAGYYTRCSDCCDVDFGGYKILDEQGIIALEPQYPFDYLYVEHTGFIPKQNGQYMIPDVSFETLVEWTKFKSIQNKKSVSRGDKNDQFNHYIRERNNMEKILGRIGLTQIFQALSLTPRLVLAPVNHSGWYSAYSNNRCLSNSIMNKSCGTNQPQVIQTIIKTETKTNDIVYRKLKFKVNDDVVTDSDGPVAPEVAVPMQEGETSFAINEVGIIANSVNVIYNTSTLNEGQSDEVSYTVVYGLNGIVINFNSAAELENKYTITYSKAVTV